MAKPCDAGAEEPAGVPEEPDAAGGLRMTGAPANARGAEIPARSLLTTAEKNPGWVPTSGRRAANGF